MLDYFPTPHEALRLLEHAALERLREKYLIANVVFKRQRVDIFCLSSPGRIKAHYHNLFYFDTLIAAMEKENHSERD